MSPDQEQKWEEFLGLVLQKAAPYLAVRADMDHARVSHNYAKLLLATEGGDHRVVEPAIILHDVGWSALKPEEILAAFGVRSSGAEAQRLNRIHEIQGAEIAGSILRELGYATDLTKTITIIISRHDSGQNPESLEEKIVKDSDKLWRVSKIGLWQELERQGGVGAQEYWDFVGQRVPGWFFTATGLAQARVELAERALEIKARA